MKTAVPRGLCYATVTAGPAGTDRMLSEEFVSVWWCIIGMKKAWPLFRFVSGGQDVPVANWGIPLVLRHC